MPRTKTGQRQIADANATNANKGTSDDGVLYKNGVRFLHDYNHGNNGTTITEGNNIFLGQAAGNFTLGSTAATPDQGSNNVAVGQRSMQSLTTGSNNVAVGRLSMLDVTTGSDNVGVGKSALQSLTTGVSNTAVGQSCLAKLTSGINNNAIGANALVSTTYSIDNNAMGGNALLRTTTGSYNTGVGARALNENTTGSYNVGIGQTAGYDSITGSFNTFIGAGTGFGVTSGENNTIIGGRVSGLSASLSNTVIIADGAGNQRLRIDSNGQAGINEQTPMAQLHTTVGSASRVGQITKLAATPSADADQILDSSNNKLRAVTARGKAQVNGTITAAGTTGARTINKPSGAVNFAAGATSLVVTCDQCTATSMVKVYVATNDTTMKSVAVVPGSGSFTLHPNAAPTAETRVFFEVIDIV